MNIKKTIINLTLLSISLGLGILLCELALRYVAPQKLVKTCYQYDSEVALAGVPNCKFQDDWDENIATYEARFNNLGYRMDDDVQPHHNNLIACIGDSFTYGWGVEIEDSFWGILNKELKDNAAPIKLVNAGFPSYSTGHCSKTLERLDEYAPVSKAIYFMFFNDIFDNLRSDKNYISYTYSIDESGTVQLQDLSEQRVIVEPSIFKKSLRWLYKHSHLAMLLRKSMPDFKDGHSHSGPRAEDRFSDGLIDSMTNVTLAHLDNIQAICTQKAIDLQIIWIPCWQDLNLENDFEWENHFPFDSIKMEMTNRYNFYDPTDGINLFLSPKNEKLSAYYYSEGHYNQTGNQLFYKSIEKEVIDFILK